MWNACRTFERADRAIAEGELWRAKEILVGNIGTQDFHAELYERYGQLLLRLGDTLEAGKYLFLSGARCPQYDRPITLFLEKYRDPQRIFDTLPSKAKWTPRKNLPDTVQHEMDRLAISERMYRKYRKQREMDPKWKERLGLIVFGFIGMAIGISMVVGVIVGVIVIARFLWSVVTH